MYIITGGAGFIGSHLIEELNNRGETDIVVVDDLTDSRKFKNLVNLKIQDFVDMYDVQGLFQSFSGKNEIKAIFHLGALSSTQESDGRKVMKLNYEYSLNLLKECMYKNIPLIYASSASIYGMNEETTEDPENEKPINVYGYSKLLFDQRVRAFLEVAPNQSIVGLRYFNVYGANEGHKDGQASPFYRGYDNLRNGKPIDYLVGESGAKKIPAENFSRDFVYVEDVVDVTLWFLEKNKSGIFNVGTGESATFMAVAKQILKTFLNEERESCFEIGPAREEDFIDWAFAKNNGLIKEKPFPKEMFGTSQPKTKANLEKLREVGYDKEFLNISQGWSEMYGQLKRKNGSIV